MDEENNQNLFNSLFEQNDNTSNMLFSIQRDLRSTNDQLKELNASIRSISQSSLWDVKDFSGFSSSSSGLFGKNRGKSKASKSNKESKTFIDGVEEELKKALGVDEISRNVKAVATAFTDELGISLKQVPAQLGREFAKTGLAVIDETFAVFNDGTGLKKAFDKYKTKALSAFTDTAISSFSDMTGISKDSLSKKVDSILSKSDSESKESDMKSSIFGKPSGISASKASKSESFDYLRDIVVHVASIDETLAREYASKLKGKEDSISKEQLKQYDYKIADAKGTQNHVEYSRRLEQENLLNQSKLEESPKNQSQSQTIDDIQSKLGDLKDLIPDDLGEKLRENAASFVKDKLGPLADTKFGKIVGKAPGKVMDASGKVLSGVKAAAGSETAAAMMPKALTSVAPKLGSIIAGKSASAIVKALATGFMAIPGLGQALLAIGAIAAVVGALGAIIKKFIIQPLNTLFIKPIKKSLEDTKKAWEETKQSLVNAFNRGQVSREKRVELHNERIAKDINSIVEEPFKILKEAAETVQQAWDASLRTINQTQGYSKSELQGLISDYANRLKDANLNYVVSSSDMISNLEQVLKSGLSGQAAEEFSYLATVLNAAVPTEDFFSYGETYASLVANSIKSGQSQSKAIEYANKQLELFASNVLYASRQISGGLSTSLTGVSDLFKKATDIAIASRVGDPSQIAGVLTSISAAVGATAPDLANSIIDAVYNAAVGGNTSSIVALRSLAGVNASNTEFLRELTSNPQKIFSTLFQNLGRMQNMSASNYMEVAEGLSSVFGMSTAEFARVDFNYLANSISKMNVSDSALNENLKQLASGESTQTAEQMKIRQINEYMAHEGLAYVLDNEVARSIQEHMWDEQLAQELMEAEYGVELRGKATSLLSSIVSLIENVLKLLNPIKTIQNGVKNLVRTGLEAATVDDRIRAVVAAGQIAPSKAVNIPERLAQFHALTNSNILTNMSTFKLLNVRDYLAQQNMVRGKGLMAGGLGRGYGWSTVSKSSAQKLGTVSMGKEAISQVAESAVDAAETNINLLRSKFEEMQKSMSDFFGNNAKKQIEKATELEVSRLQRTIKISKSDIEALAKKYSDKSGQFGMSEEQAKLRAELELQAQAQDRIKKSASEVIQSQIDSGKFALTGYQAWVESAKNFGISNFADAVTQLGLSEDQFKDYFNELETQQGAKEALERNQKEEEFWANTQEALNNLNINVHDVFDKSDVMGTFFPSVYDALNGSKQGASKNIYDALIGPTDSVRYALIGDENSVKQSLIAEGDKKSVAAQSKYDREQIVRSLVGTNTKSNIYSEVSQFRKEFYNHFVLSKTYSSNLGSALTAVQKAQKKTGEDAINALSAALTNYSIESLVDPTVQNNVLLASILQVVQAIFQQNNTTGTLTLPDALAALATGSMNLSYASTSGNSKTSPTSLLGSRK